MTQNERAFDLLAAKLEAAKDAMIANLNGHILANEYGPFKPITWHDRLRLRWLRVQRYFSTLWDALCGRDPYDDWY